jgi:hypothetical protein
MGQDMPKQRIHRQNNFIYLTFALVLLLLTSAFGAILGAGIGGLALKVVTLGTLFVAVTSVRFASGWGKTVVGLTIAFIASAIAQNAFVDLKLDLLDLGILLIFFTGEAFYAAKLGLDPQSRQIDGNLVASSVSLYLLMGLIWAVVFLITMEFFPQSFNTIEYGNWSENFHTVVYFTYVTMTSLGYGDISPIHPVSRIFAIFTAISGAFYLAIVVATVVGARTNQINLHDEDPS